MDNEIATVLLKRVESLPRLGWFHVVYDLYWPRISEREYRITVEARDELDAVVEFRKWARVNKYLIREPDDGDNT